MRLFGKSQKNKINKSIYEIVGGAIIRRINSGYEISWKSPQPASITTLSRPVIENSVNFEEKNSIIYITSTMCKLTITTSENDVEAKITLI